MSRLRTKLIYFIVPLLIIAGAVALTGSGNSKETEQMSQLARGLSTVSLNPPADLSFAGEKVPTGDFEVQERLERELIRNIYFHSASILTLKRAGRWKAEMQRILAQYGVPADFFYLCVAESQLSNATSPAGAKGYWQFVEATGRNYGLVINDQVDERLDPIKSTHAAGKYLRDAYRKFNNWTLVAASYNMGVGGVESELGRQKVKSYYDLFLNYETSAYVFRVLALKSIMENPGLYGFHLTPDQIYSPVRYRSVKVEQSIPDLIAFAGTCGTTYKMIKVMNPWILNDRLEVKKGETWTVQIPINTDFAEEELMLGENGAVVPADSAAADSSR